MNNSMHDDENAASEVSSLIQLLSSDQDDHDHESRYCFDDVNRIGMIKYNIKIRDGSNLYEERFNVFSHSFVAQQAIERYFDVMKKTLDSIDGLFLESEITLILNTNCGPYWNMHSGNRLSGMLMDDQGIESLNELDEGDELRILIGKLQKLSAAQNMALTDVCERYWRNTSSGKSLFEVFAKLGLCLKMDSH